MSPEAGGVEVLLAVPPLDAEAVRWEEREAAALVRDVAALAAGWPITLMFSERVAEAERRWWASGGLKVVDGPAGWSGTDAEPPGRYSHAILVGGAAGSSLPAWVERCQPQATRVVHLPDLAFRELDALAPTGPPGEAGGMEVARSYAADRDAALARWAHAAWCCRPGDAAVLAGWNPQADVRTIPPAVSPPPAARLGGREGVLVVAAAAHDTGSGEEDAALRFLDEVLPSLRGRHPGSPVTVVAGRPSPQLRRAAARAGALMAAAGDLDAALAGTRVVVAAHPHGSGAPAVLLRALERGAPFVCTRFGAAGLELGEAREYALCSGAEDLATRTSQLLGDDRLWQEAAEAGARLAQFAYRPAARRDAVAAALAATGILPANATRPGRAPGPVPLRDQYVPPGVALRPPGLAEPPPLGMDPPQDETTRYRLWHQRRGATPEVLAALAGELGRLSRHPVFSVLMPVFNTDPSVLAAAVDSVRSQIYDRWQLCIANDGSDRPETLRLLAGLRADPRMAIVDRPAPGGIAAATNAALGLATGDFVAFLDHDDLLKPHALAQVVRWLDADPSLDLVYSDEDKLDPGGDLYDPNFKPDWSPDLLTAQNYVCHLLVARRRLVEAVGGLSSDFDGSQDYDLVLRLVEITDRIAHIPEPLYTWRAVPGSAAAVADAKPYAIDAARRAVSAAVRRRGHGTGADTTGRIGFFRPRFSIPGEPRVSLIVPTRDGGQMLERCLDSVASKSTYRNYEIVVVDNQSTSGDTLEYLAAGPWRVLRYPCRFNYARMMNLAARAIDTDALLFLNDDTEVISPGWIETLLEHAMRPEVGAVGCRLFYPDGEPQHEGILLGIGGYAHNTNHRGYWARGELTRNVSAVTGACTMIRPAVFARVGGNDERLRVAYNDVDLCLRIRAAGYEVVYTPYAELFHHESATRGRSDHTEDAAFFDGRWRVSDRPDPYYSPLFEDFPPFVIRV